VYGKKYTRRLISRKREQSLTIDDGRFQAPFVRVCRKRFSKKKQVSSAFVKIHKG
jgi:hypothetical protein